MTLELKPDLVVLDVALPEMNGIEVTRQIRRALPVRRADRHDARFRPGRAGSHGGRRERPACSRPEAGRTLADAVTTILSRGEFISERVGRVAGTQKPRTAQISQSPAKAARTLRQRERRGPAAARRGPRPTSEVAQRAGHYHEDRLKRTARGSCPKLDVHSMSELVQIRHPQSRHRPNPCSAEHSYAIAKVPYGIHCIVAPASASARNLDMAAPRCRQAATAAFNRIASRRMPPAVRFLQRLPANRLDRPDTSERLNLEAALAATQTRSSPSIGLCRRCGRTVWGDRSRGCRRCHRRQPAARPERRCNSIGRSSGGETAGEAMAVPTH